MGLSDKLKQLGDKFVKKVETKVKTATDIVKNIVANTQKKVKAVVEANKKSVYVYNTTAKDQYDKLLDAAKKSYDAALAKIQEEKEKEKSLVEGIIDFLGGLVDDTGKFLADSVKGFVDGAVDAVNWLTDVVSNPAFFLDWFKKIVLAAW